MTTLDSKSAVSTVRRQRRGTVATAPAPGPLGTTVVATALEPKLPPYRGD
jgi:hypothetical protein